MVSICLITYNHEDYIAQSIEGVLSQKTSFNYQLIIGEDYSSDNTRSICKEYAEKFPQKIKLLPSYRNLGVILNFIRVSEAATGNYIAICEGDDYWIDEYKLQKQVDFLESELDINVCSTKYYDKIEEGLMVVKPDLEQGLFSLPNVIEQKPFHTGTLLYRNGIEFPNWFEDIFGSDLFLVLLLLKGNKLALLDDITMVHRRLKSGLIRNHYSSRRSRVLILNRKIEGLLNFNSHTNFKYDVFISQHIKGLKMRESLLKAPNLVLETILAIIILVKCKILFQVVPQQVKESILQIPSKIKKKFYSNVNLMTNEENS